MCTREAPIEVLVSDQAIDRWRGRAGPSVDDVVRGLYRRGVSFRLVSLLRPTDLFAIPCKRLVLLDSTIPDEPDGQSPARDALTAFTRSGGQILCLSDRPWRGLYLPDGPPPDIEAVVRSTERDAWPAIEAFIGKRGVIVEGATGKIFWRQLRASGQNFLLIVATGAEPADRVMIRGVSVAEIESADGAEIDRAGAACQLRGLNTFALLRLAPRNR